MMLARDIAGYGDDRVLDEISPHWPVDVEMVDVNPIRIGSAPNFEVVMQYRDLYRRYGPWALPPVVSIASDGSKRWVDGIHRMVAAHLAGLPRIPAYIVRPVCDTIVTETESDKEG